MSIDERTRSEENETFQENLGRNKSSERNVDIWIDGQVPVSFREHVESFTAVNFAETYKMLAR